MSKGDGANDSIWSDIINDNVWNANLSYFGLHRFKKIIASVFWHEEAITSIFRSTAYADSLYLYYTVLFEKVKYKMYFITMIK